MDNIRYDIWDLETEFKIKDAASLWLGIDPHLPKDETMPLGHAEIIQKALVRALIAKSVGKNYPVIPVILVDALEEPKLPTILKNKHWVDFRKKDPDPLKQLVWGITREKKLQKRKEMQ